MCSGSIVGCRQRLGFTVQRAAVRLRCRESIGSLRRVINLARAVRNANGFDNRSWGLFFGDLRVRSSLRRKGVDLSVDGVVIEEDGTGRCDHGRVFCNDLPGLFTPFVTLRSDLEPVFSAKIRDEASS